MKKLFLYAIMAFGFIFASCQGNQDNRNAEETRGSGMNDEIGGPESGYDADVQGEESVGGEAIGTEDIETEDDSLYNEADSVDMQPLNEY